MKCIIKAADGTYLRYPGDSLSTRYDDVGYSVRFIDNADLYNSEDEANCAMHKSGKFSLPGGARIIPVLLMEYCPVIETISADTANAGENSL